MQDKHQLERIAMLEVQVANLTSAVALLTHNMESANTQVLTLSQPSDGI